jgi:hypothetical protein
MQEQQRRPLAVLFTIEPGARHRHVAPHRCAVAVVMRRMGPRHALAYQAVKGLLGEGIAGYLGGQ